MAPLCTPGQLVWVTIPLVMDGGVLTEPIVIVFELTEVAVIHVAFDVNVQLTWSDATSPPIWSVGLLVPTAPPFFFHA